MVLLLSLFPHSSSKTEKTNLPTRVEDASTTSNVLDSQKKPLHNAYMKKTTNAERQKRYRERLKVADLSKATSATINEIRLAFEIQAIDQQMGLLKQERQQLKALLKVQGVKK